MEENFLISFLNKSYAMADETEIIISFTKAIISSGDNALLKIGNFILKCFDCNATSSLKNSLSFVLMKNRIVFIYAFKFVCASGALRKHAPCARTPNNYYTIRVFSQSIGMIISNSETLEKQINLLKSENLNYPSW